MGELHELSRPVSPRAVEWCEELLRRVRDGELTIRTAGAVVVDQSGEPRYLVVAADEEPLLLGAALERLKLKVLLDDMEDLT